MRPTAIVTGDSAHGSIEHEPATREEIVFVVNAPCQSSKTTIIVELARQAAGNYAELE